MTYRLLKPVLAIAICFAPSAATRANVSHHGPTVSDNFANPAGAQFEFVEPISTLEARLFADAADGRWDELRLLEAGLIASGVVDQDNLRAAVEKYTKRREQLLNVLKQLPRDRTSVARAKSILDFVHSQLLPGDYSLHATEIDRAINTGHYNCVSITLLYNCLAGDCGFRTSAIELPHHTYSILELDGERIEVEATCTDWFDSDKRHLRVSPISSAHASINHNGPSRQIGEVAIVAMIYYNRGVDALHAKRYDDAIRLNGAALCLDAQHAGARDNLRTAINNHALAMCEAGQFAAAVARLQRGRQLSPGHASLESNTVYVYHRWLESLAAYDDFSTARQVLNDARTDEPRAAIWSKWAERLESPHH